MFAIDSKHKLHIFTVDSTIAPDSGWIIISLILPEDISLDAI